MPITVNAAADTLIFDERGSVADTPGSQQWAFAFTENGPAIVDDAGNIIRLYPAYGNIYVKDGSTAQGGITTTPAKLTAFAANGLGVLVTPDHTDDSLTVTEAGDYAVSLNFSYSGTANTTYTFFLRIEGAEGNYGSDRKLGTGGDVGSASFSADVTLSADDVLTIYVENDGGTTSITVTQGNFRCERIS